MEKTMNEEPRDISDDIDQVLRKALVNNTLTKIGLAPDTEYIVVTSYEVFDPDWDGPTGEWRERHQPMTTAEMMGQIAEEQENHLGAIPREISFVNSVAELHSAFIELNDCEYSNTVGIFSKEEFQERQDRQELERLDRIAAGFASTLGIRIDSMDFIKALDDELQRAEWDRESWNSGEARAERMAECVMALGSVRGSEVYHDDNDFIDGRHHQRVGDLQAVKEWLHRRCPLLMAQYHEQKLKEKKGG